MKYGQVEEAIIRIFKVEDARLGSFRARIRHLREFDCPSIAKAKPGSPAEYNYLNAVQLAVALALESVGVTPRMAADIVIKMKTISEEFLTAAWGDEFPTLGGKMKKASFLIVLRNIGMIDDKPPYDSFRYGFRFINSEELPKYSERHSALNIINISKIIADLDATLITIDLTANAALAG
jgi:hypothetical protein